MPQQITGFTEFHPFDSSSVPESPISSKNSRGRLSLFIAGLLAFLTGFQADLLAQSADPTQSQPTLEPWLAKVTGKSVNLRAGASTNHFAFARLSMDAPVIAMGGRGDWVEIVVPSDPIRRSGFTVILWKRLGKSACVSRETASVCVAPPVPTTLHWD